MRLLAPIIAALLIASNAAVGQAQPHLETGFHTGSITALSADSAERFLVTIADDDTLRVFDLPGIRTGELRQLQLIRLPRGPLDESRIYAAAITPDGSTIATATPHSASIYLFDRASGRLLRRIAGLPHSPLQLAYSPDGRYLAAALAESGGLRLYRTADYTLAASDPAYAGAAYCAAFSPTFAADGMLATAAEDKYIREYRVLSGGKLQLVHRRMGAYKDPALAAAFSPNGRRIATSFDYVNGFPEVEVWNASALAILHEAIPRNAMDGSAQSLAWSADGKRLYLAGNLAAAGPPSLIVTADESGGNKDFDIVRACGEETECSIAGLLPLRDGSLVFASFNQNGIGLIDRDGKAARFLPAPMPFYAGLADYGRFLVSADGTALRFVYGQDGDGLTWFSMPQRALIPGKTAPGLDGAPVVDDFPHFRGIGYDHVLLNEHALDLDGETSMRLAALADAAHFLLATEFSIFEFDAAGKRQWKLDLPASPEAVNVSHDGRFAVVALTDGTLRWYRLAPNGATERLAFFPAPDRHGWVLWTPGGDYDCSPGADDLLGFWSDEGEDRVPTFVPASKRAAQHRSPSKITDALR